MGVMHSFVCPYLRLYIPVYWAMMIIFKTKRVLNASNRILYTVRLPFNLFIIPEHNETQRNP
jgi:hypothetical protein